MRCDRKKLVPHANRLGQITRPLRHARFQLVACTPQVVFHSLSLGEVPRDLGKPQKLSLRVADWTDDYICPEAGPVLADPPTLVLKAPLEGGHAELVIRYP